MLGDSEGSDVDDYDDANDDDDDDDSDADDDYIGDDDGVVLVVCENGKRTILDYGTRL